MAKYTNAELRAKLREQQERQKWLKQEKVLKRFRPRKSERMSFVFLDSKGQRLPANSRKRGFFVYATKTGKVKAVREAGKKKILPKPRTASSYRLTGTGHKTAEKRFFADLVDTVSTHPRLLPTIKERARRQGVNFMRFAGRMGDDLKATVARYRGGRQFLIEATFTVRVKGGVTHSFTTKTDFKLADGQTLTAGQYRNYVMSALYAHYAQWLEERELVSGGSARFIYAIEDKSGKQVNHGKKQKNWIDPRDGEIWEKNEFTVCELVKVEWNIRKVVIRSRKEK